jgi:predicted PurR-regulated permease PerM
MGTAGIGRRLKLFDKKTAQALLTALVFALALMFLYVAWRALITFLFAIFFAYILEAPISKLQVWLKGSRPAAIAVVYLLFAALLIITFSLLGPPVMDEAQKLMQQAPELGAKIESGSLVQQLAARHGWNQETVKWVTNYLNEHQSEMIAATQSLTLRAARTIQNMWWLVLVPIFAIFFLKDGHQLSQNIINSVEDSRNRQMLARQFGNGFHAQPFIRAQLTLSSGVLMVTLCSGSCAFRTRLLFKSSGRRAGCSGG